VIQGRQQDQNARDATLMAALNMDINEGNKYIGRLNKARRNRMKTNARQWMKQAITEYTRNKKNCYL
jgi:hypothetical protein